MNTADFCTAFRVLATLSPGQLPAFVEAAGAELCAELTVNEWGLVVGTDATIRGGTLPRIPDARRRAEVRRQLIEDGGRDVLVDLLGDAVGAEAGMIFEALGRLHPVTAIEILEADDQNRLGRIHPIHLAPLLQSEDRQIRERTLTALRQVGRHIPPGTPLD